MVIETDPSIRFPLILVCAPEIGQFLHSFLGVPEHEIPCCILFMNRDIFVTSFAAAILDLRVVSELFKMSHSVGQSYLEKVAKAFL